VNWEAVGRLLSAEGIAPKSAQTRWEALRRREDNILQGIVIHRSKTKHVQDDAAPSPKKPKKAPVPRAKRVKKEPGAVEAQVVNTQNMENENEQQNYDQVVKGSVDTKAVDCSQAQEEEKQAEVSDDDGTKHGVEVDSEDDSDYYA
jgi:hypothetical protein